MKLFDEKVLAACKHAFFWTQLFIQSVTVTPFLKPAPERSVGRAPD